MAAEIQQYWLAVRAKVCTNCIDGDGWGSCRLDKAVECPVPMILLSVVDLLSRSDRDSMQEFETELRSIACCRCMHQWGNGSCHLHGEIDCPLDRYFPQIIEAVERVHHRLQAQAQEGPVDDTVQE